MIFEKEHVLIVLVATLCVVILQAAPAERSSRQENTAVPAKPTDGAGSTTGATAGGTPDKPPTGASKPTDGKPPQAGVVKPAQKPKPEQHDEGVVGNVSFQNCWSCLLEAAEDLCSYLMDSKLSAVNIFSFFQDKTSEGSSESADSEDSSNTGNQANSAISTISSFFRFRRSVGFEGSAESVAVKEVSDGISAVKGGFDGIPSVNGVLVEGIPSVKRVPESVPAVEGIPPVEDIPVEETAFLDLLHGFYLTMRERFSKEHPGLISPSTVDLYKRPEELVEVAAYVLGVPKNRLLDVYGKMKSKETGNLLLRALDARMAMLEGEQRNNLKTLNLTPTSVSYFFTEILASVNGIATGFTEILSIALQQASQRQPNPALSNKPQIY